MFALMHKSVSDESKKMFEELRRNNYVTPSNFLELTAGYKTYNKNHNNNKTAFLAFSNLKKKTYKFIKIKSVV